MDLREIKHALLRELNNTKNQELFKLARKRNKYFTNHSTPFSVLTVLDGRSTTDYAEKNALTRCLIAEHQRAPDSLWSAILISAYLPMLQHLRHRIVGNPLPSSDLDHLIISNFLQVVVEFPLSKWQYYTCVRLRQQTQRRVFRELKREPFNQRNIKFISFEETRERDLKGRSNRRIQLSDKFDSQGVEPEVVLLLNFVGDAIDPGKLDLFIETTLRGENLRDFIKRRCLVSLDSENELEYQRLKRQRSRTLVMLRKILKDKMSPFEEE